MYLVVISLSSLGGRFGCPHEQISSLGFSSSFLGQTWDLLTSQSETVSHVLSAVSAGAVSHMLHAWSHGTVTIAPSCRTILSLFCGRGDSSERKSALSGHLADKGQSWDLERGL